MVVNSSGTGFVDCRVVGRVAPVKKEPAVVVVVVVAVVVAVEVVEAKKMEYKLQLDK